MAEVQNTTTKIYSADKQLYVGMEANEAYKDKKKYELFNFADNSGDKVIDEKEMRRYDGPLLVVEKDDKRKQRFIGHYAGTFGAGHVAGNVITSKEFEFFPGQKFEEINEKDFNLAFRDLDLDSDGELSKEEIQKYQTYVERKNQHKQTLDYNEWAKYSNRRRSLFGATVGAVLGGVAGIFTSAISENFARKSIVNNLKYRYGGYRYDQINWDKVPKMLAELGKGQLGLAIASSVAALGIGAGLLISKHYHHNQKPTDEFNDLKALDEQYKHVYNSQG